jgi:alpha-glucosidase/alpha-D-xyloside xylohydrolase
MGRRFVRKSLMRGPGAVLPKVLLAGLAVAWSAPLVLERDGRAISLDPYAPNILRVTMSADRAAATGDPGYGFTAKPSAEGWTYERDAEGGDVFRSASMVVHVAPGDLPADKLPQPMPLDALNQQLREHYFGGGDGHGPHNDALLVTTPGGRMLLHMRTWEMTPESADVAREDAEAKGHAISATFDSPADEHYYGLGQQQKGWMDLRDHEIRCWHDYGALGGEDVGVPFMVSSRGYGLVWDNPSKTTVVLGFNQRNVWSSEVADRVSYFVIAGDTSDEIYQGYRLLTGVTHMLPRAAYGYIQSKAIYPTEEQALAVAKGYRER